MGKFVKVSATPPAPAYAGAVPGLAGSPGAGMTGMAKVSPVQFIANLFLGSKKFRDAMGKKFPNIFTMLDPTDKNNLIKKISEAFLDEEFQKFFIATIMPMMGVSIQPKHMYSPDAMKYYLGTPGFTGESIASGAYQMSLERMPTVRDLPPKNLKDFVDEIRALDQKYGDEITDPKINIAKKQEEFKKILERYNTELSSFQKYLAGSFPGLGRWKK